MSKLMKMFCAGNVNTYVCGGGLLAACSVKVTVAYNQG